jgi:hypothetical protein
MAATIYMRDGTRLIVLEASSVAQEYRADTVDLLLKLVCRDSSGNVVAQFDRETVLAFRRSPSGDSRKTRRSYGHQSPAAAASDFAAT